MKSKRISAILLLTLILGTLGSIMLNGWLFDVQFPKYNRFYYMKEYMTDVENFLKQCFPFGKELKNMGVKVQMMSGEHEFDKVFIGDDILIETLEQPDEAVMEKNLKEIQSFVKMKTSTPVSVMFLPTKYAIKQQNLPDNAELFAFNQKNFIEKAYTDLRGQATTVDVYPVLFANNDKYIYYRTAPELTGLGAYYVYSVLAQRLALTPMGQEDFSLQHIDHDFYGKTYEEAGYEDITPDIITLYHPASKVRSYTVTHFTDYEYTYNTLYPEHLQDLSGGLSVLLGGDTGDITIRSNLRKSKKLLVFGDSSIMPVLPLLSPHYSQIRFIDFEHWNSNALDSLDIEEYDQMLLAYSVDTLLHKPYPKQLAAVRHQQEDR